MNNSNNIHLNILDLPDEILFIILKKLNTIDVLYSLVDVNRRFDRLVIDPLYLRDLDMTDVLIISSLCNQTSSIDAQVLSRISQKILPRVHHQVHQLIVEEYSMKEILLAGNYPQLYSLSLISFHKEILYQYLKENSILHDFLTKQITHLNIDIKETRSEDWSIIAEIFRLILSLCKGLIDLNFCNMFLENKCSTPVFHLLKDSRMSSTLTKLKIKVANFLDCLILLDGRLDCLSTLIIHVDRIFELPPNKGERKKLPKLKRFSFTTFALTSQYDDLIVPLLCRMINLEELNLFLSVFRINSTYVDGIQLYDQFLIHMTQLNKFTFNIKTKATNDYFDFELPSNEDIQRSFTGRYYQQVASYVRMNSTETKGECYIYSLPFDFEYFFDLDNSLQGGMFHKVRYLKMSNKCQLQYRLIKLISQHVPFLQFLYINNCYRSKNKTDLCDVITFPYLTYLNLNDTHDDYTEAFLLKRNAHLPRLLNLRMDRTSLERITMNFTKDVTLFNFGTLKSLNVGQSFIRPGNFHEYFPLL